MAIVIAGKNYSQLSGCETTSDGGSWAGVDTPDSTNYKEGSNSLCGTLKANGNNDAVFTPTASVDMSGTGVHLRCWYICTSGGLLNTFAAGGIQLGISDGSNECFWYLAGRDTYPGGWINLVVDVSSTQDTGTKPTAMNAITSITVRNNQTLGKNVDNVWVDNLCLCDGLIAYGDDGDYFDFEDIFLGDDTSLGIGIIRKIGGQYFLTGSIEYGDSAGSNGCKFQAKSQVVIFEDRPVNADLYNFDIVDNGTGTTEFILGDKSGTAGIQGCTIRAEDESQSAKFDITGSGTNVDNFKLYASSFFGADSVDFPPAAATVEILGCSYELCGQVYPNSADIDGCFFINTTSTDSALLWNEGIDITDCSFIANETGAAIEMPSAVGTPYTYDGLLFSGNTYDVYNSSGSAIVINKTNGSNPTTYSGSGVTFSASFNHIITGLELNTEVTYVTAGTSTELYHVENASVSDGDGKYKTTYSHGGGASVDVLIHHINFKPDISNIIGITLPNAEATVKVQMFSDENYYNPA
jgi:hypothetical protein